MKLQFAYIPCLLAVIALVLGCAATGMQVPITKPAEINLTGISKIAIGDIGGPGSTETSELLTTTLFNSGRYEVLDRQNLDRIFTEHRLSLSGAIDEQSAAEIGRLIGTAALIFGRVGTHKYEESRSSYDWTEKSGRAHRTYTRTGTAQVAMSLQVTDLRTGKIVAIKQLESTKQGSTSETDKDPPPVNSAGLLASARESCIQTFMRAIAPYTVFEKVSFEKDKNIPELERGIASAKMRDLSRAAEIFTQAADANPTSPKAHFDLGIALMCLGEYDRALAALEKAYSLAPSKKYNSEISRCRSWRYDAERLKRQLQTSS